jgi:hypothetical protein
MFRQISGNPTIEFILFSKNAMILAGTSRAAMEAYRDFCGQKASFRKPAIPRPLRRYLWQESPLRKLRSQKPQVI